MALLDPIFDPLLSMDPLYLIVLTAFCLTLIITIIYKYVSDQKKIKFLRAETKELQQKMRSKEIREDKEQFEKIQKQMSKHTMDMMKQNFKPMFFTILPALLVFGWMSAHLVYLPIIPGLFFNVDVYTAPSFTGAVTFHHDDLFINGGNEKTPVDGKATWSVRGEEEGRYIMAFQANEQIFEKPVLITEKQSYENPVQTFDGPITSIEIEQKKLQPFGDFSLFGWKPGWLGTYIMISILLSFIFRKLLKVQ